MVQEQSAGDPRRMAKVLAGVRAYQQAARPAPPPQMPALLECLGATVRDYGGDGPAILFVPSLINPPSILDLAANNSLLRWLASQGHHVLLLDWGWQVEARRQLSVAGHVERILLPFLAQLPGPAVLVGYCLGGTMAIAAAARAEVRGLATIAAPWHFAGYPADGRERLGTIWSGSQPVLSSLGVLPMEALQSAFWALDPARTVAKFEAFADLAPASEQAQAFVALEDWANDGPPLPEAAAREVFEAFLRDDRPGSGAWSVGGAVVDPVELSAPFLNIVSSTDRIVPRTSASVAGERLDLALGHVGMVAGSRGRDALWAPLSAWLSRLNLSC